jgi:hypothetical protein
MHSCEIVPLLNGLQDEMTCRVRRGRHTARTSSQRACFSAQTSMDLRRATFGASTTGGASAMPVQGQEQLPPASQRSIYRRSYLQHACQAPKRVHQRAACSKDAHMQRLDK